MRRRRLALVLAAVLASPLAAEARSGREEVSPSEEHLFAYDANIPGCDNPAVLARVATNFAEKEAKFWQSSLTITAYEQIRRTAWRPWGLDYIPRRFCSAMAWLSDGSKHRVDYSVREDQGIIGMTWGVEFCVRGLDRNWAYAPACQMARP